jgi:hypothetical protein
MHHTPVAAALLPMTGVAFILFTFYMVTDPATTPATPRAQLAFGASTAILYGLMVNAHIVFGLFFSLSLTCAVRAVYAVASAWNARKKRRAGASGTSPRPRRSRGSSSSLPGTPCRTNAWPSCEMRSSASRSSRMPRASPS